MPVTSSSALALAARLRVDSDDELVALLRAREVRDSGIRDFFDLAEKLLDPASIQLALSRLDRPTLAAIAALATGDGNSDERALQVAREWGLVAETDGVWSIFEAVANVLQGWPAIGLPSAAELAAPAPATLEPVSTIDLAVTDAAASDRAFTTTAGVAEIVASVERTPARELARGGIALPDSRRLAEAASIDLADVPALQRIAENAGLIALEGGAWFASDTASEWMLRGTAERWSILAGAWLDQLPDDIRELLGDRSRALWGEHFEEYLRWFFPAGGERILERVATHTRAAALLGIIVNQAPSSPGTALLSNGVDVAAEVMASHFPREVSGVYLQHDLTIVSPGPLEPALDARLRTMADIESRALASTYRMSSASLNRALSLGETAASITAFLEGISLTGIPQPLGYVIAESAARYGLVRVGTVDQEIVPGSIVRRAYVRSSDASLLRTIRVDQGLSPLSLTESDDGRLTSRFDVATVFWALADARYPVIAEAANGTVLSLERARPPQAARAAATDHAVSIVERLRLLAYEEPGAHGAAWIEHQLDVAIRAKVTITVTVTMPDGTDIHYLVQPTSLASGRLRALDRTSDIERTLPLSHITAVTGA